MQRKEHYGSGNPNLYLKPLKNLWDVYGNYDPIDIVIIDDWMLKHSCNGKGTIL